VNLVTLGEYHFGNHQFSNDNLACIVLGTGTGIGIILNGQLFRQAHELGHMAVKFDGRKCTSCGRSGCLEAYCSGNGLQNYYQELFKEKGLSIPETISVQEIFNGYKMRESIATVIVVDFIQALSCAMANILLAFSITNFVIAGGISASFSVFQDQVKIHSKTRTMSNLSEFIVLSSTLSDYRQVFDFLRFYQF